MTNESSLYIFQKQLEIIEEQAFPISSYAIYEAGDGERKIWDSIKEFLRKMRTLIETQIKNVQKKFHERISSKKVKKDLETIKKMIQLSDGKEIMVDFYDVWEYEVILQKTVKELSALTKAYMTKYRLVGNGLTLTNAYTNRCKKLIEKSEKKLSEIKEKKIKVDAKKLLEWVESQEKKGRSEVFAFAEDYLKEIKEIEKTVEEMDKKAEKYASETGMVAKPTGILDNLKNASIFVKRNIDWIGMIGIIYVTSTAQKYATELGIQKEELKKNTMEPDRGSGSMLHNSERTREYATRKFNEGRTKNKTELVASRVLGNAKMTGFGVAANNFIQSVRHRKNSV